MYFYEMDVAKEYQHYFQRFNYSNIIKEYNKIQAQNKKIKKTLLKKKKENDS